MLYTIVTYNLCYLCIFKAFIKSELSGHCLTYLRCVLKCSATSFIKCFDNNFAPSYTINPNLYVYFENEYSVCVELT